MKKNSSEDIIDVFLQTQEEANNYLSQYGDTGHIRNIGVSLSYDHIAKHDPLFVWFSAATLGSIQVGKNIDLPQNPILSHCDSINTISLGFTYGNQVIHNNVVALYYLYKSHGVEGLKALHKADLDKQYLSINVVNAFEKYDHVYSQAEEYSKSVHLTTNNPRVIKHILADSTNLEMLKDVSSLIIKHEQSILESMYEKKYYMDGKNVGETLNDTSMPEKFIANYMELSGAKILDKYISTDGYDLSDYYQRIAYFDKVLDAYFEVLSQDDGFEKLTAQREAMVSSLGTEFIPYGEHFQPSEHDSISMAEPSHENATYPFEHFAFTWDNNTHQWNSLADANMKTITGGIWVSQETYPITIDFLGNFPLVKNSLYFDLDIHNAYIFSTEEFLPNLPSGYLWHSFKNYMEPSEHGYVNGGSIWTITPNDTDMQSMNKLILSDILSHPDHSLETIINNIKIWEPQNAALHAYAETGDMDITAFVNLQHHIMPEMISVIG